MSEIDLPESLPPWIKQHIELYLGSGGKEGHLWDASPGGGKPDTPTLLLFTKGRSSGKERVLPLIYGEAGGGYVVIASKGGAPEHPSWYLNLVADPEVGVQVATDRFQARARVVTGAERDAIWQQMAALYPPYNDYQAATSREIPVVLLERHAG